MPEWLKNAVFYEIYPQSFQDSNADGVGDFKGIISRLDYIASLGATAIWLNPCFDSPFGDAGYDVSDYLKAAPRYGTNEDLKKLFDEAHSRGIRVLLDLVPGHTSVEHPWFKESLKAERNEFSDRYVWTDSVWKEPAGMASLRGISDRNGSCAVNFFSHQPALNYGFYQPDPAEKWQQPTSAPGPRATLEAMKDVMRFWLGLGADGFRVDMAGSLVKNDPESKGTIALWQEVREFLDKEFPEAAMVSEWGEPDKSLAGGFHMDFLLHFGPSHYNDLFRCEHPYFSPEGKGDASGFIEKYRENYLKTAKKGLICIPSGNHDMDRLARSVKDRDSLKLAFMFLLTMPGAPFIYYGDEIGMRYVEGLTSKEGGFERTGSRSPMQWDKTPNAGFSAAAPGLLYVPIDPADDRPTVAGQEGDPLSLLSEVRRLTALRRSTPELQSEADVEFLSVAKGEYPLCYTRAGRLLVIINPTAKPQEYTHTPIPWEEIYRLGEAIKTDGGRTTVPPMSGGVYRV